MEAFHRYLETMIPEVPARLRLARRRLLTISISIIILGFLGYCLNGLRAASASAHEEVFVIQPGEGMVEITDRLEDAGIIKSANAFRIAALLTLQAHHLQAGHYLLAPNQNGYSILRALTRGSVHEIEIRVPEGASSYQIDSILADAAIIRSGELINYVLKSPEPLEGKLFPDSYRFFPGSSVEDVVKKMRTTFDEKALSLLEKDQKNFDRNLILASMLEKEVPDLADRKIVAGIILKRFEEGMALQIDSSLCYMKQVRQKAFGDCLPITALDLKFDSPYNTYLHSGWPPGPIGNPGLTAIQAALSPQNSPYWFYLSDPETHKTIFSKTLDEHAKNRAKYL